MSVMTPGDTLEIFATCWLGHTNTIEYEVTEEDRGRNSRIRAQEIAHNRECPDCGRKYQFLTRLSDVGDWTPPA